MVIACKISCTFRIGPSSSAPFVAGFCLPIATPLGRAPSNLFSLWVVPVLRELIVIEPSTIFVFSIDVTHNPGRDFTRSIPFSSLTRRRAILFKSPNSISFLFPSSGRFPVVSPMTVAGACGLGVSQKSSFRKLSK